MPSNRSQSVVSSTAIDVNVQYPGVTESSYLFLPIQKGMEEKSRLIEKKKATEIIEEFTPTLLRSWIRGNKTTIAFRNTSISGGKFHFPFPWLLWNPTLYLCPPQWNTYLGIWGGWRIPWGSRGCGVKLLFTLRFECLKECRIERWFSTNRFYRELWLQNDSLAICPV